MARAVKKNLNPPKAEQPPTQDRVDMLLKLFQPVLDFHQTNAAATDDDIRIMWDVRLIRGKDEAWAHVSGTSTLPGVTAVSRCQMLSSVLQDEIESKISAPLVSRAQEYAQSVNETRIQRDLLENKADVPQITGDHSAHMAEKLANEAEVKADFSNEA